LANVRRSIQSGAKRKIPHHVTRSSDEKRRD
jgi:hypothetical protein